MKKHTKKKEISFNSPKNLTIVVACIAVLLAIYLLFITKKNWQTNSPSNTNIAAYPTTNPALINASLYLLKNPETNTIYMNIKTDKQAVSGVQLAIAYDPKVLQNVSVTPGGFFDHPVILQNAIDTNTGIIYYTLSINPNSAQISGEGTVAILHYTKLSGTATKVSFLPQTKITSKGVNDSILKQASSVQLP